MTKKEAIEFINECVNDKDEPYGFMVVAISKEDLACHHSVEVVNEFNKLSKQRKENVLSAIADELNDKYQEWNFSSGIKDIEMDFELLENE